MIQPKRVGQMWWALLFGIAFVGPIVEVIEENWLRREARKELGIMRSRVHAGHRWDTTRGQWQS